VEARVSLLTYSPQVSLPPFDRERPATLKKKPETCCHHNSPMVGAAKGLLNSFCDNSVGFSRGGAVPRTSLQVLFYSVPFLRCPGGFRGGAFKHAIVYCDCHFQMCFANVCFIVFANVCCNSVLQFCVAILFCKCVLQLLFVIVFCNCVSQLSPTPDPRPRNRQKDRQNRQTNSKNNFQNCLHCFLFKLFSAIGVYISLVFLLTA